MNTKYATQEFCIISNCCGCVFGFIRKRNNHISSISAPFQLTNESSNIFPPLFSFLYLTIIYINYFHFSPQASSPRLNARRQKSIIWYILFHDSFAYTDYRAVYSVRLGSSGLKVSRIILGCMSYGSPEWEKWLLPEDESIKHIKAA